MSALDDLCPTPFHLADSPARARVLSRLADTELFVALAREPEGELVELAIHPLEEGEVALACDSEERLAGFLGGPVVHLAIPGRVLAGLLAAEGRGLLVNPGQPSEMLLGPELLGWLGRALGARPAPPEDLRASRLFPPEPAALAVLAGPLAERLADMAGLVGGAALLGAEWPDARRGHLLVLRGVAEGHRAAVAKALGELLAFLPEQPGGTDIAFSDAPLPRGAVILELAHVDQASAPAATGEAAVAEPSPPRLRW